MRPSFSSDCTRVVLAKNTKWVVIASATYLALPFDVVPLLGMMGDLTALFVAINAVKSGLSQQREDAK